MRRVFLLALFGQLLMLMLVLALVLVLMLMLALVLVLVLVLPVLPLCFDSCVVYSVGFRCGRTGLPAAAAEADIFPSLLNFKVSDTPTNSALSKSTLLWYPRVPCPCPPKL